jgi:hypothetical protein
VSRGNREVAPLRVLPDDVYEAIHLASLAFDGVGEGEATRLGQPHCALGIAAWVATGDPMAFYNDQPGYKEWKATEIGRAIEKTGLTWGVNDGAMHDVPMNSRIPFEEWCKRLNVVPASAVTPSPDSPVPSPKEPSV